jgi:4-amino-4-deoxy-L-arabinose transferase-like glycosyltransferase
MPSRFRVQLYIILAAALLFLPGLGAVHLFDWDENNFAEIAREMVVTGDWLRPQIGYLPFHEKPPLFMWLQALSMKLVGVNEYAARFPNAMCGILTLLVLYRIGDQLRGRVFAILWPLAYVGSILPHLYFRSGIIDPWFNLFIFLGIHAFITLVQCDPLRMEGALNSRRDRYAWIAGMFFGLAVLTKGPVGVLIPGLMAAVYWVQRRFRPYLRMRRLLLMVLSALLTVGAWAVLDLLLHGPEFMVEFFWRQVAMLTTEDAGHGGFPGYHVVVLLIGCFPASAFALKELLQPTRTDDADRNDHRRWMVILFWVVLILFSIVRTKIVHYSSMAYFPLTYLAALQLEKSWRTRTGLGWARHVVGGIGLLWVLVTVLLPIAGMNIGMIEPLFAQDPFARANLEADVSWTGVEMLAGLWLLGALLAAHVLHARGRHRWSIITLFAGSALFVTLALFFFINRIEAYSQRAAIEFHKARQGEQAYVITKGFKSYAHLFYTRKPPVSDPRAHDEQWLLHGEVDRPVYVVSKITSEEEVRAIGTFEELYRSNGFIFWRRSGGSGEDAR